MIEVEGRPHTSGLSLRGGQMVGRAVPKDYDVWVAHLEFEPFGVRPLPINDQALTPWKDNL